MKKDDLAVRLYFEPRLYESARIIGYGGISPFEFWDNAKALTVEIDGETVPFIGSPESPCTQAQVQRAIEELTRWEKQEGPNPVYELKSAVRRACHQLLGPAPEHPLCDFIRHGPPDIMGEENAKTGRSNSVRRKRKKPREQTPKSRPRSSRRREAEKAEVGSRKIRNCYKKHGFFHQQEVSELSEK